jgi:hypothetical protein
VLLYQLNQLLRQEVFLVIRQRRAINKKDPVSTMGNQLVNLDSAVTETDGAQFCPQGIGQVSPFG